VDRELLAERYELHELHQPGRFSNPLRVLVAVLRCDVVVGWWASWHTFLPVTLAWLLRRPSLLIVGGFDTACEPEIGYGYQLGGARAWLSRWTMRRATALMTNSHCTRREIERNTGIPAARVHVVYHGIPERPAGAAKTAIALSVGNVDRVNLERKGQRAFVEAAERLPEVEFVLAGAVLDEAGAQLRASAPPNVLITGWLDDAALSELFGRAGAYVQPSVHEGFGVAVAEAMLAGCVPVVTRAGALVEVVGDTGVLLDDARPETVAAGIKRALEQRSGGAARARVLAEFSVEQRRRGLFELVDELL
jgi:glycosyltransferase involved in cell wall biosynthesis